MKQARYALFLLLILTIFSNRSSAQATNHGPIFSGGHFQSLTGCENVGDSLNSLLAINDSDVGDMETWSVIVPPSQGMLAAIDTMISTGATLTPSGLSYTPGAGYSGADSFVVSISDGLSADTTTIYVTINPFPAPGTIFGAAGGCAGDTTTLFDSSSGGSWSSSDPAIASIDSVSGMIAGVSGGSVTISYSVTNICGSALAVFPFTVNTSAPIVPVGITGLHAVCNGASITLHDATPGGKWTSSDESVASIDSITGIVTGVSAGLAGISYSETNFCASYSRVITLTVDPIPATISGATSLCTSAPSTLSDSLPGGTWSSSSSSVATIGPVTGMITGMTAGTAIITYAAGVASCKTMTTVTVNVSPGVFTMIGGGSYCSGGAGSHVGLSGSVFGIRYQLYHSGTPIGSPIDGNGFALDFGAQPIAGAYSVIATDTMTGCNKNMSGSAVVSINPLPTIYTVYGGGSYCVGAAGYHIFLVGSQAGISYQLYNGVTLSGAAVFGTGGILDFGLHAASGTYTVTATNTATGCTRSMGGSATITINSSPVAFDIIGGGGYCAGGIGVHIGLDSSVLGINYQLYNGSAPFGASIPGTGIPLDFGLISSGGIYTVMGSNATTACATRMTGSTTVTVNPLPVAYPITGGGHYCLGGTGRHVLLSDSRTGVAYQLFLGATSIGTALPGTDTTIDFGLQMAAGSYSIIATDGTTGCGNEMTGSVSISIDSPPHAHTVIGGGSYCAGDLGVYIELDGSDPGTAYQLYNGSSPSGIPGVGSGGMLDLGLETDAGSYTVIATNESTHCTNTMTGSVNVIVNPVPAPISGIDSVFVGHTTSLTDATPGGTWSSKDHSLATVGATGIVYGDSVGRDSVFYTLSTGCYAVVEMTVDYLPLDTTHTAVGQMTNPENNMTLFPNPTTNSLNIKWENQLTGAAGITIVDVAGREVYHSVININASSGQMTVDVSNFKDGLYMISINSESFHNNYKLLIRR